MNTNSLWGDGFDISPSLNLTKKVVNKSKELKKVKVKKSDNSALSIEEQIRDIDAEVRRILGKYIDDTETIYSKERLHGYITHCIENKIVSIDTETNNSLDPISCKIMGLCLYTPNEKNAYIPINHIDIHTKELLPNQLTEQDIKEELNRINTANMSEIIMHNGKFDYEVIHCTCDINVSCTWDTLIASMLIDENVSAALKFQYRYRIDSSQEKYDIEHLFKKLPYEIFPPELFALYAATDPYITYKLYEWQKEEFNKAEFKDIYNVFRNIEMPCIDVIANMELYGNHIDEEYGKRLSAKYHKIQEDVDIKIQQYLANIKAKIDNWRTTEEANIKPLKLNYIRNGDIIVNTKTKEKFSVDDKSCYGKSKNEQLTDPPTLTSPTQMAILIYDVFNIPTIDTKKPKNTDEKTLAKIAKLYPEMTLCNLVLEKRGIEKLIGTYVDKIPKCVSPVDNRLHAEFNQYGARTGRLSSSGPNLQNLPSKNNEIRLLFKAEEGKVYVGADYSQQEPRLLSSFSGDINMIHAYQNNKDLYATVAAGVYKNDYWDNMEHHEDGTPNSEGKKRRKKMKSLILGILYGMGATNLAESLQCTKEEAQQTIDSFYEAFPTVKKFIEQSKADCKKNGFVTDLWGRKRRLPNIQLPPYEITSKTAKILFNPLIHSKNVYNPIDSKKINEIKEKLLNAKSYKERANIKQEADKAGFEIHDNNMRIAEAERECTNARIQGSASSMTKIAMRKIYDSKELNDMGFHLTLQIHDELIGEVPIENAERCAEVLADTMRHAVEDFDFIKTPFKCDAEIEPCWYYNDYFHSLETALQDLIDGGLTKEEAFEKIAKEHTEMPREELAENLLK